MPGHRPFSDIMKVWSPERRARSDGRQAELAAEMVTRIASAAPSRH